MPTTLQCISNDANATCVCVLPCNTDALLQVLNASTSRLNETKHVHDTCKPTWDEVPSAYRVLAHHAESVQYLYG